LMRAENADSCGVTLKSETPVPFYYGLLPTSVQSKIDTFQLCV
jgi:hypothetical protein